MDHDAAEQIGAADEVDTIEKELQEEYDPRIRMNDMLLEASIPEGEPTIFQAIRLGDMDMVRRQIREGFDINIKFPGGTYKLKNATLAHRIQTTHYTAFHLAALHSTPQVMDELLQSGASINITDEQSRTALHFAVVAKRVPIIKLLISKGTDVNLQSSSGRTAFLEAVIVEEFNIAKLLVEAGTDINICDIKGASALHTLCLTRRPNVAFIKYLLSKKCDVDVTNLKGSTSLMLAASMRQLEVAKLLVEHGAEINKVDKAGMSPIQFIVELKTKYSNVLLYFVHHGASVNHTDRKGRSLLDMAMRNMSLSTIVCLLLADCHRRASVVKENEQVMYLCDRLPKFKEWLDDELDTPRSLTRCCRSVIRDCLSPARLARVDELDIPRYLKNVILCRDILPSHLEVY